MGKILLTATVQSHIAQFHKPLIKKLQEKGHEVHVAARNNLAEKNGLALSEPDQIFDIPFERSPLNKKNIQAYRELKQIISQNDYLVIHCNTPVGGVLTRLAANRYRKVGLKVFYTAHGFHFYKGAPLKNWLIFYPIEKFMATFTDKLFTIVEEDYLLANSKFNTDVERIHGVGANSNKYFPISNRDQQKLRQEMGFESKDFLILCTGELNRNKNQATVIAAAAEVVKKYPKVKLLLAGNGPLDSELKEISKTHDIEKNVYFLGYRTDLEKFVKISDLVVSASIREGLGLNIIEAMLCKKATIASKNRGHNELIMNGENGSLVDYDDVKGFSQAIQMHIEDLEFHQKVANNGYQSIQKYKDSSVIQELELIYQDIN